MNSPGGVSLPQLLLLQMGLNPGQNRPSVIGHPLNFVGDITNPSLRKRDAFAGEQTQRDQLSSSSSSSHQQRLQPQQAATTKAAATPLHLVVVQVAYRLRRCEIGSGFNFSLFTILHTTRVKYKATEACQRRMGHAAVSNWTVCYLVTAKVHKRLWSRGNKLESAHVAMYHNVLTALRCSWMLAAVEEDDSSCPLQDVCIFQCGSV